MPYTLYRVFITIFFFLVLLPVLPLILLFCSKYRYEFSQRLAWYPLVFPPADLSKKAVWIHAASVGEIQATKVLISELTNRNLNLEFIVTTMTEQGHKVASDHLPDDTICLLAPLDVPVFVKRALKRIGPDIYICMETELWPVMLNETKKFGVKMILLNGRMSQRSFLRYSKIQSFMEEMLSGFSALGVISEKDEHRFKNLGFSDAYTQVTGNIKYDLQIEDKLAIREKYRSALDIKEETVFICGSTRTGEEKLLSKVYSRLMQESNKKVIWIIAPRHLERINNIVELFKELKIEIDLYSELRNRPRLHNVVLVDCMGILAELYAAGDYNFCGGSLVNKGGHNIMEAARFGRPVYFGPSMKDFQDAVDIVKPVSAGFQVTDENALGALILNHMHNKILYNNACRAASRIAAQHHGAAERQADMVVQLLAA